MYMGHAQYKLIMITIVIMINLFTCYYFVSANSKSSEMAMAHHEHH